MSLRIYNTLSRGKDVFEPVSPGRVGIYLCGPTVYGPPHIGHLVGPIIFDAVKRYLRYKGYAVTWVVNITDIDDKIIDAAATRGVSWDAVARQHTEDYLRMLGRLGIEGIDQMPKVSDHLPQIIAMIQTLIGKGHAYVAGSNVWFDVRSDADYGRLAGRRVEEMEAGTRVLEGSGKRSAADFALWKSAKPGEPSWPSPWGDGRPGWHIECSAMSTHYLGQTLDIHGGGDDLKFPHHENELAQSECATGHTFSRCWMHNGLITVGGVKMSKSLGNVVDPQRLIEEHGPQLLRYLVLSTHYRSPVDFDPKVIESSRKGLATIARLFERVARMGVSLSKDASDVGVASGTLLQGPAEPFIRAVLGLKMKWLEMMDDDFNTAGAIAAMHELVTAINTYIIASRVESTRNAESLEALSAAATTLRDLGRLLGLNLQDALPSPQNDELVGKLVDLLIEMRREAREAKDFALGDQIRQRMTALGITLEDNRDGTSWRRT